MGKQISLKDLLKFTGDLNVLYVEDQLDVMEKVLLIFSKLFKSVITASDGIEGVDKYLAKKPDLVITDINMPNMNGLEFIEEIRRVDRKQPVIITSAHNENDYLIKAISLGVDGFILKPINSEQIYNSLLKTCKSINSEKEAEYYKKHLEERVQEEVIKNQQKTEENFKAINRLIEAYPTPVLVRYPDKRVRFANFAFRDLFHVVEDVKGEILDINDKLLPYEDKCFTLDTLNEKDSKENVVAVKTLNGKKVFRVFVDRVPLSADDEEIIYTFSDITIEEYRKQKIKNYSGRLEDYIIKYRKERTKYIQNSNELEVTPIVNEEVKVSRTLEAEEEEILRKSHHVKIPANEYCKDVDTYVLDELAELSEIEEELKDLIFEFEESKEEPLLRVIGDKFLKYGSTVSLLFEFEDLSVAIKGVSDFTHKVQLNDLDEKKIAKLSLITKSIIEDLTTWRDNIFISQTTKDIHYLDSSLFSSCLQLEITVMEEEVEDSDCGELDLF